MNEIAVVTEQDIPDILRMIHEIYSELPNKEWFSLDSDEEVTSYMMTGGFGLKAMCDGRLAGVFIARAKNLGDENLGYDLKFDEEQRKQSAHMEIAMVRKEYRGQGLQRKMMEESEQILKEQGYHYLLGTAHPDNVASVNTFLKLQYEQVMTKEKYGGVFSVKRYNADVIQNVRIKPEYIMIARFWLKRYNVDVSREFAGIFSN